jgi:hypothetical protein
MTEEKDARLAAERLERATADAKEVLRQTRGVQKDLHATMKAARRLIQDLCRDELRPVVEDTITDQLLTVTSRYRDAIEDSIERNKARVMERFDAVMDLMKLDVGDERFEPVELDDLIRVQKTLAAWKRHNEASNEKSKRASLLTPEGTLPELS